MPGLHPTCTPEQLSLDLCFNIKVIMYMILKGHSNLFNMLVFNDLNWLF